MASIRFYAVDNSDWYSRLIQFGGHFKYDMTLTHVALEFDGGIVDMTCQGFGYYTLEDEMENRPADVILYLNESYDERRDDMYVRSTTLAFTDVRLKTWTMLKKAFGLQLGDTELLCTDFVQVLLGDEPQHLTPIELIEHYYTSAYSITIQDTIWDSLQNTLLARDVEAGTT